MKNKLCFILLGMSMMLGCFSGVRTARLYPVQGPLAAQAPSTALSAKITGRFNSGNISVVLSDGEVCLGPWAQVPLGQVPKGASTASGLTTNGMSSEWDIVYGSGFYVSHVLGAKLYAQAVVSGDRGTVLNVEMYRPENIPERSVVSALQGVAKDNKGNIYKLVF